MQLENGQVAVVTGGASGIGLALARAFLGEGLQVVVADVEAAALDRACEELSAAGRVEGVVTDVTDATSVERLAATTFERFGACHVLCNNAGVGAPSALVWETTVNDWRWVHGVNVMGVVHGIQAFVPRMIASGAEGFVVNTSSGDGGIAPMPAASVYASSKAAVTSLTECLAAQLISELARERPRTTEAMTIEKLEAMAQEKGFELSFQDLDELARIVLDGIRAERFVMMIDVETIGTTMRDRATALEQGALPQKHAGLLG
jgi:NAD(P)-dependent dehydrogenase (short-subunit alcohol dehydrogenase family)